MKELNLLDFNVKIDSNNFNEQLYSKIELIKNNKISLVKKLKEINTNLNQISNDAMIKIKDKIHKPQFFTEMNKLVTRKIIFFKKWK